MPDTKTYASTPQSLSSLATMLAEHGIIIDPTQPSGEVVSGKWDIAWVTPEQGQITITVKSHPFAEEGILWSKLDTVFAA